MTRNSAQTDPVEFGIPDGMSEKAYASWRAVLRELKTSKNMAEARERYQFCCGYLQALNDQGTDERVGRALYAHMQRAWANTREQVASLGL